MWGAPNTPQGGKPVCRTSVGLLPVGHQEEIVDRQGGSAVEETTGGGGRVSLAGERQAEAQQIPAGDALGECPALGRGLD